MDSRSKLGNSNAAVAAPCPVAVPYYSFAILGEFPVQEPEAAQWPGTRRRTSERLTNKDRLDYRGYDSRSRWPTARSLDPTSRRETSQFSLRCPQSLVTPSIDNTAQATSSDGWNNNLKYYLK